MSIYGRNISDDMVEDAVLFTLKRWLPTELRVIEEKLGLVTAASGEIYYERPKTWAVHNDFSNFPEEILPAIVVVSTGLSDTPIRDGRKRVRASYLIGIGAVAGAGGDDAQTLSRRYAYRLGAAARNALMHHQSLDGALDGTVRGVDWIDGRNNEVPSEIGKTAWATRQVFAIEIDDVLTVSAGPAAPDAPPPAPTDPIPPTFPTIPDREHVIIGATQVEELPE